MITNSIPYLLRQSLIYLQIEIHFIEFLKYNNMLVKIGFHKKLA